MFFSLSGANLSLSIYFAQKSIKPSIYVFSATLFFLLCFLGIFGVSLCFLFLEKNFSNKASLEKSFFQEKKNKKLLKVLIIFNLSLIFFFMIFIFFIEYDNFSKIISILDSYIKSLKNINSIIFLPLERINKINQQFSIKNGQISTLSNDWETLRSIALGINEGNQYISNSIETLGKNTINTSSEKAVYISIFLSFLQKNILWFHNFYGMQASTFSNLNITINSFSPFISSKIYPNVFFNFLNQSINSFSEYNATKRFLELIISNN